MFKIENLNKTFIGKTEKIIALNDVSFNMPEKGFFFILGKSGSGKTTLVNILSGLEKADSGNIFLNQNPIHNFSQYKLDNYRNGMTSFIFQDFKLIESLDVYENIILPLKIQNKKINEKEIDLLFQEFDLDLSCKKRKIFQLSQGQQQRVSIIRALIKNYDIVFADEPTGNLDEETGLKIFEKLKLISKKKLVIMISHDKKNAYKYADYIIELDKGKLVKNIIRKKELQKEKTNLKNVKLGDTINPEILNLLQKSHDPYSFEKNFEENKNNFYELEHTNKKINFVKSFISLKLIFSLFKNSFKKKKILLFSFITMLIISLLTLDLILLNSIGVFFNTSYSNSLLKIFLKTLNSITRPVMFNFTKNPKILNSSFLWIFKMIVPCLFIRHIFYILLNTQHKQIKTLKYLGMNGINILKIFSTELIFLALTNIVLFLLTYLNISKYLFFEFLLEEKLSLFTTFLKAADSQKVEDILAYPVNELVFPIFNQEFFVQVVENSNWKAKTQMDILLTTQHANPTNILFIPFLIFLTLNPIWRYIVTIFYFAITFSIFFFICNINKIYKLCTNKPIKMNQEQE
jgi:putative ABC transport system ATP-binding protein